LADQRVITAVAAGSQGLFGITSTHPTAKGVRGSTKRLPRADSLEEEEEEEEVWLIPSYKKIRTHGTNAQDPAVRQVRQVRTAVHHVWTLFHNLHAELTVSRHCATSNKGASLWLPLPTP
jgi:hypothetical protein